MENIETIENPVTEEVAEKVEVTTEETPKTYTEDEMNAKVNEIVGKRLARKEAKIRKEYEKKYGDLENTLRVGTGKETVEEINETFRKFYEEKGVKIPEKPIYSERDIEVLAKAEAEDIIRSGYDEVVEEVERLAKVGANNMTPREKAVFVTLAQHRQNTERLNELTKLGVSADVYNSSEFTEFASKFNSSTPIKDIYDIYQKTKPKKEYKTMGSMTNTAPPDNGVKDFYSYEEASKFTKKELDKNPKLYEAIRKSMLKW